MGRTILGPQPINAATFEQRYRAQSDKMLALRIPTQRRTCICCKTSRTLTQFNAGALICKNCQRHR